MEHRVLTVIRENEGIALGLVEIESDHGSKPRGPFELGYLPDTHEIFETGVFAYAVQLFFPLGR